MMPTAITMNSDELVKAISCPPTVADREDLVDLELMDRIGHDRSVSSVLARRAALRSFRRSMVESGTPPDTTPAERITLSTPAVKPSKCEHEHPPRQGSEPAVDQPADTRTDQHTRDKLGREPETAGERRMIGRRSGSGACFGGAARTSLVEPLAETLEPRGEGGFLGRRCS